MMGKLSVTTLFAVVLGVGLAQSVSDIEFDLVLGNIDLLKAQVELLRSRTLSQYRLTHLKGRWTFPS